MPKLWTITWRDAKPLEIAGRVLEDRSARRGKFVLVDICRQKPIAIDANLLLQVAGEQVFANVRALLAR